MSPWGPAAPWWLVVAGCSAIVVLWHTSVIALLLELWRAWSPAAPARRQYVVAAAALGCAVALTAATPFVLVRQVAPRPTTVQGRLIEPSNGEPRPTAAAPGATPPATAPPLPPRAALPRPVWFAMPWIGAVAIAGVFVGFLRVAGGWALALWIRRRAVAVRSPHVANAAAAVRAAWGLPEAALLTSPHVDAPVVVGARTPAILLPPDLERHLGVEALSPLLAHELAHVRRRDYAANLCQSFADALLWFCPGARWISRRIREAREYCCDDVVAQRCGVGPYATALTTLAGLGAISRARPALNAVGPRLIVRIRRLLEEEAMNPFARYRLAGLLTSVGLAAAAGIAVVPVSAAGVAQAASPGGLTQWPVPYNHIPEQKGAAVILHKVLHDESTMCATATVENRANIRLAGLRFVAFAHPRRGSHEPIAEAMRTSGWLPVDLAPGETASIGVALMLRDEIRQIAGPDPQVSCALTEIRYANGAGWRSPPLVVFAPRHAEIPRALVGAPAPSDSPICKDDEGLDYSHGAIIRIALEPGTVATCDNGRWTEGSRPVGPLAAAR